jgi:hypothetical protein
MRPCSMVVAAALFTTVFAACDRANSPVGPSAETLAGVTSVSSAVNAGAAASKTTPPEVPFRGTFVGHLTASTPIDPPLLSNLIEASGQSSQLGRFALEIPHVVNATTREAMGSYEFTAANGDGLTATFTGLGTVVAPGVVSVLDTATVTGGTGRFEDATGSFTVERIFTFATGEVTGAFEGTITPASASRQ